MKTFQFGPWKIAASEIFYVSKLSLGLVNYKPVVPVFTPDVLVLARRVVPRFADLTSEEVTDLYASAHAIAKVVEPHYAAESLTITLQDGPQAGQTVPHVHVHVIPRRKGDWADNDDIYDEINRKEKQMNEAMASTTPGETDEAAKAKPAVDNDERQPRTQEDMAQEATVLRKLFQQGEDIWS
ncbi:hypothetical protein HKX48_005481 [Thoreauomyces humboldtii]|nr:hypothetical protein HKX48_005481 [Thoreauomyces humboldtii]